MKCNKETLLAELREILPEYEAQKLLTLATNYKDGILMELIEEVQDMKEEDVVRHEIMYKIFKKL